MLSTVVADEIGNNHFGLCLQFLGVTSSKLFDQFGMHTQLLQSQRQSGAVRLFVRTQVIIPDFICRNCMYNTA